MIERRMRERRRKRIRRMWRMREKE